MWQKLKTTILQVSEAAGIELIMLGDDSYIINIAMVKLHKSEIEKTADWIHLKSIEEIQPVLDRKIPISVVVSGKNILVKMLPFQDGITSYFTEVLPHGNPNEFYCSTSRQNENIIVAIARREYIDSIISNLTAKGYKILDINFAFTGISILVPFLINNMPSAVELPSYNIRLNTRSEIISFENQWPKPFDIFLQEEYLIGKQYIKAPLLLPFAAASRLLATSITDSITPPTEKISGNRVEYKYFKYFNAVAWTSLVSLFFLLLINFAIYNFYFNKNRNIEIIQSISSDRLAESKKYERAVKRKEQFLVAAGWIKPSKTSYYADRIASLVSSNLTLTAMEIFPANSFSFENKKQTPFKLDTIQVTGICTAPLELNQFINNLKNLSEIKEVTAKNYLFKKENDNASFIIEIVTR